MASPTRLTSGTPGGAWALTGASTRFSVVAGAGLHTVTAGLTNTAVLGAMSSTATDATAKVALSVVPERPVSLWLIGRRVGTADYAARTKVAADGTVELRVTRSGTALAGGTVLRLTLAAGQ